MRFHIHPRIEAIADAMDRRPWGGNGRLAGSLPAGDQDGRAKIMNVPARVQISVLVPVTWELVARTVSKDDGTWQVLYLDPTRCFTVIGSDLAMSVNSAIQDWVQPAPMDP